jgi:DNA topoisomerase 2-associated protein PAT1
MRRKCFKVISTCSVHIAFSDPHPFIALIAPLKGKKFIGRLGRDLTEDQKITALSVIVNRIEQVDVIRNASILDSIEDTVQRRQIERQAYAFQEYVINQGLQLPHSNRSLRTYNALIEMMIEDTSAFARVVNTRVSGALSLLLGTERLVARSLTFGTFLCGSFSTQNRCARS